MKAKDKEWIDQASYFELLKIWRHAPAGYYIFDSDTGRHFVAMMDKRKAELKPEQVEAISKAVGFYGNEKP